MPTITVKGTDLTAKVDAKYRKQIPRSVWVDRIRSQAKPVCRYEGKTMTLVRAVGLMAGHSPTKYLLPRNGDHFDCRAKNVAEFDDIPATNRPVYKNSKSGIKGIRTVKGGHYAIVLCVNGHEKGFGSSRDLDVAREILDAARKLI